MRFDGRTAPRVLTGLKMNEYSAVGRPAQEGAVACLMKRRDGADPQKTSSSTTDATTADVPVSKSSALLITSSDEGHAHVLRVWDDERGGTTGSSVMMIEGAGATWHDHPWVIQDDGSIEVAEVLGHTHEIDQEAVMQAVLSFMKGRRPDQPSLFGEEGDEMTKSTQSGKGSTPDAALKAKAERADRLAGLSADEFAYFKTLEGEAAEAFLAAAPEARSREIEKARKEAQEADPVVYTATDGTIYRKSQEQLAKFARKDDERDAEMAKMRKQAETSEFVKRAADELPHLPGSVEVRAELLKAVAGIEDEDARGKAYQILVAKSEALGKAFDRRGTSSSVSKSAAAAGGDGLGDGDPDDQLDEMAKKLAEEKGIPFLKAYDQVLNSDEGRALYSEAHPIN